MEVVLPSQKKILFAPLYWGMGHTTRCIPIIRQALQNENQVFVLANSIQEQVLNKKLQSSKIQYITDPITEVSYGRTALSTRLRLFQIGVGMQKLITEDYKKIRDLQKKYEFDTIISDARLGMHHPDTYSILINHQTNPRYGIGSLLRRRLNKKLALAMDRFDEVWVPDLAEQKLAGELSDIPELIKRKSKYIGWLSHLDAQIAPKDIEFLFILSGPEPQRSLLESQAIIFLDNQKKKGYIAGGNNAKSTYSLGFLSSDSLSGYVARSQNIICRSGYSTMMDLKIFEDIIVYLSPTSGQPEQEYLYSYHIKKGDYKSAKELLKS